MPPRILFLLLVPLESFAIPIRLEKKGIASLLLPKFPNKSRLSIKNCLFSGRDISNRVRLVMMLSTSTFEKSGFKVISRLSPFPTGIFMSPPNNNFLCDAVSLKFFETNPFV